MWLSETTVTWLLWVAEQAEELLGRPRGQARGQKECGVTGDSTGGRLRPVTHSEPCMVCTDSRRQPQAGLAIGRWSPYEDDLRVLSRPQGQEELRRPASRPPCSGRL